MTLGCRIRTRAAGTPFVGLLLLLSASCADTEVVAAEPEASVEETEAPEVAPLPTRPRFAAQEGWQEREPANSMRIAEYVLPEPKDGAGEASLVVYHFGNAAGSVEDNLARWRGQMETEVESEVVTWEHAGFAFHQVDLQGSYVAETSPGSGQRRNDPDHRLIATVLETPSGAYYVKLLGPAATVAHWLPSHQQFLEDVG